MNRLNYGKTFLLGFGFFGISVIWMVYNSFVPLFLANKFQLSPAWIGFFMTLDNIAAFLIQPPVGAWSDRLRTPIGRRMPFILIGAPIGAVVFGLIPLANVLPLFVACTSTLLLSMAFWRIPVIALMPDITPSRFRSQANGIINLMGGIGSLLAFLGGGYLFNNYGHAAPFIAGAILMVVALSVALWRVREPPELAADEIPEAQGSVIENLRLLAGKADHNGIKVLIGILFWFMGFNALEAALSSFAVFSLGIAPGTAAIYSAAISLSFILFALPAGLLGTKFGRRSVIIVGLIGLTILLALAYFLIQGPMAFVIVLVLGGLFWALVNVNSLPLVYDFGDEKQIGAFTGLYYFSSQLAAVLGPTLGGILVDVMGDQYRWMFPFSAFFMALAFLVMTRIRASQTAVTAG